MGGTEIGLGGTKERTIKAGNDVAARSRDRPERLHLFSHVRVKTP